MTDAAPLDQEDLEKRREYYLKQIRAGNPNLFLDSRGAVEIIQALLEALEGLKEARSENEALRTSQAEHEALKTAARTYEEFTGAPCPLCHYEDGEFESPCVLHARIERLHENYREREAVWTERYEMLKKAEAEIERLKRWTRM